MAWRLHDLFIQPWAMTAVVVGGRVFLHRSGWVQYGLMAVKFVITSSNIRCAIERLEPAE
jgi:hypothetical protein